MIVCVGLNHRIAPLDIRARCTVARDERHAAHTELIHRFRHAVLLSTCGRLELYLDPPELDLESTVGAAHAWFAQRAATPAALLSAYTSTAIGEQAVRHMVRVSSGLDSAVVGEDEILGQMRRAWLDAGHMGALSPPLDAAFRLAIATGRQARRLGGTDGWTSFADAAVAHVAGAIASHVAPRVLVAGTGPMGLRAARSLRVRVGSELQLALAGRTADRVAARARELDARPLSLADIPEALAWADAAVFGLRTRLPLVAGADIAARRAERPLAIVDLSVPRAVDADVAELAGVTLTDVDGLGVESHAHGRWDQAGRAAVESLVNHAVGQHISRTDQSQEKVDTLVTLRLQAEAVRRSHVERTLQRLPDLDDEARWRLDALTRALVNRLLHEPTMRLKADPSGTVAAQIQTIFGLPVDA